MKLKVQRSSRIWSKSRSHLLAKQNSNSQLWNFNLGYYPTLLLLHKLAFCTSSSWELITKVSTWNCRLRICSWTEPLEMYVHKCPRSPVFYLPGNFPQLHDHSPTAIRTTFWTCPGRANKVRTIGVRKGCECGSAVQRELGMHKALCPIPSSEKINKNKRILVWKEYSLLKENSHHSFKHGIGRERWEEDPVLCSFCEE